jgi:hypothetical protein
MKLRTRKGNPQRGLPDKRFGLAIIGSVVDHRGEAACAWCNERCDNIVRLTYEAESTSFRLNDAATSNEALEALVRDASDRGIILEATTLGFVEIAHCCRRLIVSGARAVEILYVEPLRYSVPHPSDKILLKRDFSLTDVVRPFSAVPGWIRRLTLERRQNIVFFLGFEGERLDQAIEQLIITPQNCSVVFGVPAFRPGWEMNAFANNIQRITESKLRGGVNFCGADNPAAVFDLLQTLSAQCGDGQDLIAVPIGTKPHAIGVALYAATQPNLGLVYDFPQRRKDRSESEGMWHLFEANFS